MPVDVIMPALGMAQETGTILRWLKEDGAVVGKGEPLLEIETDKVTVEIEAPAGGILAGIRAGDGAEVPVGTVIALVLAEGESFVEALSNEVVESASVVAAGAAEPPTVAPTPARAPRRRLASPKARRVAAARGIDLDGVAGSGPNGAVVAADVEAAATASAQTADALSDAAAVGSLWRTMAERTTRSWQEIPQFALTREVDAGRLTSWRETVRRRPGCEAVSITDLLVKICAESLRRHPRLTSSWRDGALVSASGIGVGIAIATDDALVVPVVHAADELTLGAICARRRELVAAARSGKLQPEDVRGGVFTISNLGMYGVDAFQAIVNAPQAAIIAVGRIIERPVVVGGGVHARPMLTLTVSYDHRVLDGARGAEFLETLASLVEEPAGLIE